MHMNNKNGKLTQRVSVPVSPEMLEKLRQQSFNTRVPYTVVARLAFAVWIETGKLPKSPRTGGG